MARRRRRVEPTIRSGETPGLTPGGRWDHHRYGAAMQPTRRELLFCAGAFLASAAIPSSLMRALPSYALNALHEEAQSLAQRAHGTHASAVLREANTQLAHCERLASGASGAARIQLHRTAGLVALVGAYASWWSSSPRTASLLDRADAHAVSGGDTCTRAQVYVLRSQHVAQAAHAVEAGSREAVRLLTAALNLTSGSTPSILRSLIRYSLAWEYAALGDTHTAQQEMDAAEWEHDRAAPSFDVVDVADGTWKIRKWSCSRRGAVLARLHRHADTVDTCSQALVGTPLWQTSAMVDIARSQALSGEVDAAASMLEDAYLLNLQAGLTRRQERIHTARQLLPDCPSVRQLDSVLRSPPLSGVRGVPR